jgi:hypothetical protein
METGSTFWVVDMETGHTRSTAYGETPEKALEALVSLWVERHCASSNALPGLPWTIKDGINFGKAALGQGYMLAHHDRFWMDECLNGEDPRLAETWNAMAERYGIDPDADVPRLR